MKSSLLSVVGILAIFGSALPQSNNVRRQNTAGVQMAQLEKLPTRYSLDLELQIEEYDSIQRTLILDHAFALPGGIMYSINSVPRDLPVKGLTLRGWMGPDQEDTSNNICVVVLGPDGNPNEIMKKSETELYKQISQGKPNYRYSSTLGYEYVTVLEPKGAVPSNRMEIVNDKLLVQGYVCAWPKDGQLKGPKTKTKQEIA